MSSIYLWVLFIHSWLRWVLLAFGLWLLVVGARGMRSGQPWGPSQDRVHVRFLAVLDTQLLLGLSLYFFLSPLSTAAMHDFGAAMKNPPLRFFGVEHIVTMLIAVAVAHIGRVRSKRKSGPARYRSTFVTQIAWLVLTLLAIPWPMLDIGRPLFRMFGS
jgi:hypothetical protein